MNNRIFFQHYELALDNIVDGIHCVNEDHGIMHPFIDFDTGKAKFECLECDYKIVPGMNMWNALYAEVRAAQEQSLKEFGSDDT